MYEVNRSLALLKPRQPYLDWLTALPGIDAARIDLSELKRGCNALLIPPADDVDAARDFVLQRHQELFEAELADWCEDDSLWPAERDLPTFLAWFDVEVHAILTDLVDEALERESFDPFDLDLN